MNANSAPPLAIHAPIQLNDPDSHNWDQDCEVLVVGLGAAGSATAISAKEGGADVLVLDRFGLGGATAQSGGIVYAGGGTAQQKAAGYNDTPENMYRYLQLEVGDAVKAETLRRFCDDSPGLIKWLESLGARFDSEVPPPKTSYPPDGTYLYFSGNEGLRESAEHAEPAPRGHRTKDAGLSGQKLFSILRQRVDALQIPVQSQCAVSRLIVDSTNAVVGVEYQQLQAGSEAAAKHAKLIERAEKVHNALPGYADRCRKKARATEQAHAVTRRVRVRNGVALCTGGFVFNGAMVREHAAKFAGNMRLGATGCDGSGIRLGISVGGQTEQMHKASAWRFINPPLAWVKGLVVGPSGQRFCVETAYGARLGVSMCEEHHGQAWLILDKAMRRETWKQLFKSRMWIFQSGPAVLLMLLSKRASSLAALAKKIGLPQAALESTVAGYNAAARGESEDELGKYPEALQALEQPSYAALKLSYDNPVFPLPTITLGGLKVDEETGHVLNAHGQRIQGLHAAGRTAVGVASNNYLSGLSIADCLWSGRRAGRFLSEKK